MGEKRVTAETLLGRRRDASMRHVLSTDEASLSSWHALFFYASIREARSRLSICIVTGLTPTGEYARRNVSMKHVFFFFGWVGVTEIPSMYVVKRRWLRLAKVPPAAATASADGADAEQ